eukprot:756596-Hanusia_phi.AAC.1
MNWTASFWSLSQTGQENNSRSERVDPGMTFDDQNLIQGNINITSARRLMTTPGSFHATPAQVSNTNPWGIRKHMQTTMYHETYSSNDASMTHSQAKDYR